MIKIRVWCEFLSPSELSNPRIIELLKKYNVNLQIALPYKSFNASWIDFLKRYQDKEIEITLWALLSDELGYWPNERNVDEFSRYIEKILECLSKSNIKIPWIAIDLEAPIYQHNSLVKASTLEKPFLLRKIIKDNKNEKRFRESTLKYKELNKKIHQYGAKTIVASQPLVIEDLSMHSTKLQDIMETPVTVVPWDVISFMIYNSMFVGYSRGLFSYSDARYLLYEYSLIAKKFLKEGASVSLGVTDVGKLGNEPFYEEPKFLVPDIEAAKSAGISDICIFNLEGILKRGRPEDWFEVILNTPPKKPKPTLKGKLIRKILQAFSKFI